MGWADRRQGQRALWLLLTPFLLANIAYWALPYAADTAPTSRTRRATEALQRLFALSMTHTLVLAAVGVSMDLIGWQCAAQSTGCPDRTRGLGPLTWSWLDQPGRQLAVTALVPLAVVGLLWWLANKTWRELETTCPRRQPANRNDTPHPWKTTACGTAKAPYAGCAPCTSAPASPWSPSSSSRPSPTRAPAGRPLAGHRADPARPDAAGCSPSPSY